MRKKVCTRRLCVTVICIIGVLSAGRATADESAAPDPYGYSRSRLTGDWDGARNELADKGVTVNVDVLQSLQGVVDGGIEKDWKYGGSVDYEFSFNFEKLGLWPGAFIDIRLEQQFGEFINTDTGSIFAANTDGLFPLPDYHEPTLSKFVFTQFLSESLAVMLGKIDAIDGDNNHFAGSRGKTNFMNQNFVFTPVAMRTAPYSSLGAGAVLFFPNAAAPRPTTLAFTARGADGQPNTAGWDDDFRGGTVYAIELSHPTNFFDKSGNHLFGGTYSNKDYTVLDPDARMILRRLLGLGTAPKEEGSWCFYYNFHQYLFTEQSDPTQGWGVFGRFGIADDETSPIEDFYSIGLGGKGLIDGRDQDRWGVGYFLAGLSDELPAGVRELYGDSQGWEAFYNIEITPYLQITPDVQIIDPGRKDRDSGLILGVRGRILF